MNTITLSVGDGIAIGSLLESLLDTAQFDEHGDLLAQHIATDIADQIPVEYFNNENQLEFNFTTSL